MPLAINAGFSGASVKGATTFLMNSLFLTNHFLLRGRKQKPFVKDLGDIGELANEDDSSDDEGLDYDEESEDEIEKEGGNDESTEEEEEEEEDDDVDEDEDEEESDLGTVSSDDLEWESGSEKEGDEANKNIREQKDTKRSKTNTSENNGKIIPSRELNSPQISKNVINKSDDKPVDEYNEGDTSDEEDIRNTVGNVPKEWYDEYRHLGYDWDGKKILKPEKGDQLDYFLKQAEDPNFWRTVVDPQTGQDVVLSDKDIELVQRMLAHKVPDPDYDEYPVVFNPFRSYVARRPTLLFCRSARMSDAIRHCSDVSFSLFLAGLRCFRLVLRSHGILRN
ncbi:Ribosome biogenesis protein 1 [Homalodisca vitripennis]|nr:Ribosome biogenesis protein 1 [Homalodisca vitripennis]